MCRSCSLGNSAETPAGFNGRAPVVLPERKGPPGLAWLLSLCMLLMPAAPALALPAPPHTGTIVLLPIDDRPAVAQFARMIGRIADHEVVMPPPEMLGRFTRPGDTRGLALWLRQRDYSKVDALVVSVDMLAYGGLVASRTHGVPANEALNSLAFFREFKKKHPKVPVYAFSVIMRVAPTASSATRAWHEDLARWSELKDRAAQTGDPGLRPELAKLEKKLDRRVVEDYLAARKRNLQVNLAMIDLLAEGNVDALLLLQDDARVYGLHRQDQKTISARLGERGLADKVAMYNGADEGSLSLVSRAILEKHGRPVRVFAVLSGARSASLVAPYEDRPLQFTVENQIRGAGGIPVATETAADYKLFVNAPGTGEGEFQSFLDSMMRELREGRPVALADVLFPLPHRSGADERIIRRLEREDLFDRFTGYAAWNTAGNTLGTAIPQANMRVLALRMAGDPARAARAFVSHLEFLLHRFAGDYIYHDVVRPAINHELQSGANTPTDEFAPEVHERIGGQVADRLRPLVLRFFDEHFNGRDYPLVRITGLRDLEIFLPWPRTFEVAVHYEMEYRLRNNPPAADRK